MLQLHIASLDFNQIVKLCRQHHLLSALAYILNRGLNDFVTPAAELLLSVLASPSGPSSAAPASAEGAGLTSMSQKEAAAVKLLAYLRCCFRGEAFPPGDHSSSIFARFHCSDSNPFLCNMSWPCTAQIQRGAVWSLIVNLPVVPSGVAIRTIRRCETLHSCKWSAWCWYELL